MNAPLVALPLLDVRLTFEAAPTLPKGPYLATGAYREYSRYGL